jgi:two-component system sensor histidine kinase TtrS
MNGSAKLLIGLLSGLLFLSAAPAAEDGKVHLGISEFAEKSVNEPIIPATVRALEETLGRDRLEVKTYPVAALQQAAKRGEVDFILSSAGTYRRLAIEGAGIVNLATAFSSRAPNPNYADGSVFFTRRDRTNIAGIADLRGKSVAANHEYGFSGWQIALGEIRRRGFDEQHFFGRTDFKGHDMAKVIEAVRSGASDAGIVRACFLEDMGIDPGEFKILDARPQDTRIGCVHSTDLYPNWAFSILPGTAPELSRRVAGALFSMQPVRNGLGWGIATDFRGVDRLFRELRIGPFAYLRQFSLTRFVSEHSLPIAVALCLLLALIVHAITVTHLVKKRTAQLEASFERERTLERERRTAESRLASLQKQSIIGQMSSIIAHELRQPLASISMYCYGLLRRFEQGTEDRATTVRSLEKIADQTNRASSIVSQVRSYARGSREREPQNLVKRAAECADEVRRAAARGGARIEFSSPLPEIWVEAGALELEIALTNLIKNAAEALAGRSDGLVRVTTGAEGARAWVEVSDNGAPISDADWETICTGALRTSKEKGLGLGLSIVRSIAGDLGGRAEFTRRPEGGLTARVTLPRIEKEGESA